MEYIKKIAAFIDKYRWSFLTGLLLVCIMQQCTITSLRRENYILTAPHSQQYTETSDDNGHQETEYEKERNKRRNTSWLSAIAILLGTAGIAVWGLYRFSIWPFSIRVSGKIWQDLNGKIVYTLNINNKSRESMTVSNAIIEFSKIGQQRKFKMPVSDLPITLTPKTTHSVNVSLQKLIETHQELLDYKMIRVSVEGNGKTYKTFPQGVKWRK